MGFFDYIVWLLLIVGAISIFTKHYTYYLHMFQLNSYFPERYRRWKTQGGKSVWENSSKFFHYTMYFLLFIYFFLWAISFYVNKVQFLWFCVLFAIWEVLNLMSLGQKIKVKKPLVYTKRIFRLIGVTIFPLIIFALLLGGGMLIYFPEINPWFFAVFAGFLLMTYFSYFLVLLANFLLHPLEKYLGNKYIQEAKDILEAQPDLMRIGITGSYGKTSTKFILESVLKTKYLTLATPQSFNTTLGVTRTIRENFSPNLEAFIAEMGAKKKGDIQELCDLVKPNIGVITAVGPQHLETFGTIDNIIDTKFELANAVARQNGIVFVNIDDQNIRTGMQKYPHIKYQTFGESEDADIRITNVSTSERGSQFKVCYQGQEYPFRSYMLGKHNISNLTAGIALGLHLGLDVKQISIGIRECKPIAHRLELKMEANYYILDDAYNSNPVGANNALEVLKSFSFGKKIIMTPGMVELGEKDDEIHYEFGQHMAECVDIAILVGDKKTKKIQEGLYSKSFPSKSVYIVENVFEGFHTVRSLISAGDILLIENDLPDNY